MTPLASPLARPENLHYGASGAPLEQHALTYTHLQHIVPAFRMGKAEYGESEVSPTFALDFGTVDQFYVVACHAVSIGHSIVWP